MADAPRAAPIREADRAKTIFERIHRSPRCICFPAKPGGQGRADRRI
jgi:hypothetical protein